MTLVVQPFHIKSACITIILATAVCMGAQADDIIDYNRDVRPILSDNCYKCHGPDAAERKAGLRLDSYDGAVAKLDSGVTAIVPAKIEQSELISGTADINRSGSCHAAGRNRQETDAATN